MAVNWSLAAQPRDYIGDVLNAFKQGREAAASRDAAQALASGDPSRAMNAFGQAGNPQGVMAVQDRQNALQRQGAQDARLAQQDQIAAEDRAQRAQTAKQAQGAQIQQQAATQLLNGAKSLLYTPPEQRVARFQSEIAPMLLQMGVPQGALDQVMADQALSDQEINSFIAQFGGQTVDPRIMQAGGNILSADPISGRVSTLYETPEKPEYKVINPGETLYQIGGGAPQSAALPTSQDLMGLVGRIAPGATVTSGARTAAHNAALPGSVPNSYHIPDANGQSHAVDVTPPPGMTLQAFSEQLKAQLPPGVQVVKEANHVHLEPAPAQQGPRVVAQGAPKPDTTPAQQQAQVRSDRSYQNSLRQDYQGEPGVKNYKDVAASYTQTRALATARPSAQSDIALTYSYMKMLDPGSVVREGEYALVARGAGVPDRFLMAIQGLDKGRMLTPKIRAEMVAAADQVYQQRRAVYDELTNQYRTMATEAGVDPNQVIRSGGLTPPAPARAGPNGQSAPGKPADDNLRALLGRR